MLVDIRDTATCARDLDESLTSWPSVLEINLLADYLPLHFDTQSSALRGVNSALPYREDHQTTRVATRNTLQSSIKLTSAAALWVFGCN
jgi:hypothetical protein